MSTSDPKTLNQIRAISDPVKRYKASRDAEPLMKRALADIARDAVTEMYIEQGLKMAVIGGALGISTQRVAQLVSPERRREVQLEHLAQREEQLQAALLRTQAAKERALHAADTSDEEEDTEPEHVVEGAA